MSKVPPKGGSGNEGGGDPLVDGLVLKLVRRGQNERERERFRKRTRTSANVDEDGVVRSVADLKLQQRIASDEDTAQRIYGWADPDQAYQRMLAELRAFVSYEPPVGAPVAQARVDQVRRAYEALTGLPIERAWERQLFFEAQDVLKRRTPGAGKRTGGLGPQPLGMTVVHGPPVALTAEEIQVHRTLKPGDKTLRRRAEAGAATSGYTILNRLKAVCVYVPPKLTALSIDRALDAATLGRGGRGRRNIETVITELIQAVRG